MPLIPVIMRTLNRCRTRSRSSASCIWGEPSWGYRDEKKNRVRTGDEWDADEWVLCDCCCCLLMIMKMMERRDGYSGFWCHFRCAVLCVCVCVCVGTAFKLGREGNWWMWKWRIYCLSSGKEKKKRIAYDDALENKKCLPFVILDMRVSPRWTCLPLVHASSVFDGSEDGRRRRFAWSIRRESVEIKRRYFYIRKQKAWTTVCVIYC